VHVRAKPSNEVQGIVCRPPRQDCIEAQIWERVQKTDGSHPSVKGKWQPAWSLPEGTWRTLRPWERNFSGLMKQRLNSLVWMPSVMSGGNQAPLITWPVPSLQWSMVEAASCCGDVFRQQELDLRLGPRFIFQQVNNPKHTAKITKEWLRDNSVNVLEWPSQSPDLNPMEHLWRDLKMAVHRRSPSNLMELDRFCKEECEKLPKRRCAKLVASYSKRLEAVIAAKGASTKYWAKAVNIYVHVTFYYYFFIYLQKF